MKLLFHLPCYPAIGGIQTVTDIIVKELIKKGYEVHIISHFEQASAKSTNASNGIKTFLMRTRDCVIQSQTGTICSIS